MQLANVIMLESIPKSSWLSLIFLRLIQAYNYVFGNVLIRSYTLNGHLHVIERTLNLGNITLFARIILSMADLLMSVLYQRLYLKGYDDESSLAVKRKSPAKRSVPLKKSKILNSSPSKDVNDSTMKNEQMSKRIIDFEINSVDIDVDSTSTSASAEHDMCMLTVASSSTYSISEVYPSESNISTAATKISSITLALCKGKETYC